MYQLMIANYEDSQKQLTVENSDMRTYLKQMQKELVNALNEKPRNKSTVVMYIISNTIDIAILISINFTLYNTFCHKKSCMGTVFIFVIMIVKSESNITHSKMEYNKRHL